MTERWLPVVGWEGRYEVSDLGRVRSVRRVVQSRHNWHSSTRVVPARVLKATQRSRSSRYQRVNLARDGKAVPAAVHRLVLEAFIGPAPQGAESLHGNGDPSDNRLANLRWGTARENQEDRRRHGRPVGPVPGEFCRNGHEYAKTGIHYIKGARRCRACRIEWQRKHRARHADTPVALALQQVCH